MIGAGAIGSFSALTLAKMGVRKIYAFDEDVVSDLNIPNQFYRKRDIRRSKVDALKNVLAEFSDAHVYPTNRFYKKQKLKDTVVVATDSMRSRKLVWKQFLEQSRPQTLIEARMGAQLGRVYIIRKKNGLVRPCDKKFYEDVLYDDSAAVPLPCTASSIIYNVAMISSLICRAFKATITNEKKYPREIIFSMTYLDDRSYMFRR